MDTFGMHSMIMTIEKHSFERKGSLVRNMQNDKGERRRRLKQVQKSKIVNIWRLQTTMIAIVLTHLQYPSKFRFPRSSPNTALEFWPPPRAAQTRDGPAAKHWYRWWPGWRTREPTGAADYRTVGPPQCSRYRLCKWWRGPRERGWPWRYCADVVADPKWPRDSSVISTHELHFDVCPVASNISRAYSALIIIGVLGTLDCCRSGRFFCRFLKGTKEEKSDFEKRTQWINGAIIQAIDQHTNQSNNQSTAQSINHSHAGRTEKLVAASASDVIVFCSTVWNIKRKLIKKTDDNK